MSSFECKIFFSTSFAICSSVQAQAVEVDSIFNAALSACSNEIGVFETESGQYYNRSGRYISGPEIRRNILGSAAQKRVLTEEELRELVLHAGGEARMLNGALGSGRKYGDRDLMLARVCIASSVEKNAGAYLSANPIVTGVNQKRPDTSTKESAFQQNVTQSIALAQQNQARGEEQARKKGRKEHRPDLDAKECLQLNPDTRMLRNACSYKIEVTYCSLGPKPANNNNFDVTWAFSCTEGKGRFGADTVGAGKDLFGLFPHRTDGGLFVAACREEYPKDVKFSGSEITYQCRPI